MEQEALNRAALYRKIISIMEAVRYIQKTGTNTFDKYNYATEADVLALIRKEFIKHKLLVILDGKPDHTLHRVEGSKQPFMSELTVHYAIVDADTGAYHTFSVVGLGQDRGDKAVYKAFTGANKYALLKLFQLPTGDDPESEASSSDNPKATELIQRLGGLLMDATKGNKEEASRALSIFDGKADKRRNKEGQVRYGATTMDGLSESTIIGILDMIGDLRGSHIVALAAYHEATLRGVKPTGPRPGSKEWGVINAMQGDRLTDDDIPGVPGGE